MCIRIALIALLASVVSTHALGDDPHAALRDYGNRMAGGTWHQGGEQHSYRWHFADKFMVRISTGQKHLAVIGVDPTSNQRTEWVFKEDGTVDKIRWTTDGHGDSYTVNIPEGTFAGTYKVEHEKDQITITPIEPSASSPFQTKNAWMRKPLENHFPSLASGAPSPMPAAMSGLNNVLGFKRIDSQMAEGQKAIGTSLGQWILGGKFFLYASAFTLDDQSVWGHLFVCGIDPETGKATLWEFSSEGNVGKATLSGDGRSISGRVDQTDGSVFEFAGTFRMDGDVWRYTSVGKTKENPNMAYSWNWTDVK